MIPIFDIIVVVQKNDMPLYNSPLISGLISGLMGLLGVYFGFQIREKNENESYEYLLLSTTKDLLDARPIKQSEMNDFYNNLHLDLRAQRLKTFKTMVRAISSAKKQESYSSERDEITTRLNRLKKGNIFQRIGSKIKTCHNFSQ
jgi:hypothetical protein